MLAIANNYLFPNKTDNLFRHCCCWCNLYVVVYLCICVFINHFINTPNDHFGVFKKGNKSSIFNLTIKPITLTM